MRMWKWMAALCCITLPGVVCAGGIGVGTLKGSYEARSGIVPVRGYFAVIEPSDDVKPLATQPDPAHCDAAAPLHRETTLAWQARSHALLAINANYFYMPHAGVPECQLAPYPYKAGDFDRSLPPFDGASPAVIALGKGARTQIGYADQVDASHAEVVMSGDWIRGADGKMFHRALILSDGHANPAQDLDPRTAVGVQRDTGRLVVVVIEGRRDDTKGLSLNGLATLMRACGVMDAINFDGGGSATFSYSPQEEPLVVKSLKSIPLNEACNAEALRHEGLSIELSQHPLNQPLRSRAPGGPEISTSGFDKGYRRVLTNLGFRFDATARTSAADAGAPQRATAERAK